MTDPVDPEAAAALTDEPSADAMTLVDGADDVRKMTHEVDTDDMFTPDAR